MTARNSLITGPCRIVRGSGVVFTQGDARLQFLRDTFDIETDAHGKVDERDDDVRVQLDFTPDGRWDANTIAFLWPYASTLPGTSIFGAADTPTAIHDSNSHLHTIIASAVTQMPSLILSSTKTMIGPATILGVRANNADWDDADNLYTLATSGGTFTDTGFSPSLIKTLPYVAVWGSPSPTGFDAIRTQDGWTIDFDLRLDPIQLDEHGTLDLRFNSLSVMARCRPSGPTASQLLTEAKVQGTGAKRGRSLGADGNDLVITADDGSVIVTLYNAGIKGFGYRFGRVVLREDEIGFVAQRPFAVGVPGALFSLAVV